MSSGPLRVLVAYRQGIRGVVSAVVALPPGLGHDREEDQATDRAVVAALVAAQSAHCVPPSRRRLPAGPGRCVRGSSVAPSRRGVLSVLRSRANGGSTVCSRYGRAGGAPTATSLLQSQATHRERCALNTLRRKGATEMGEPSDVQSLSGGRLVEERCELPPDVEARPPMPRQARRRTISRSQPSGRPGRGVQPPGSCDGGGRCSGAARPPSRVADADAKGPGQRGWREEQPYDVNATGNCACPGRTR